MTFKSLLRKYRKRNGLTKVYLAEKIGKTDGYIRKVENDGYTPPTYKICQVLAKTLKLAPDEESEFFEQAFKERTKRDSRFHSKIKPSLNEQVFDTGSTPAKIENSDYVSRCTYCIRWECKHQAPLLDDEIKKTVLTLIQKTAQAFQYHIQDIEMSKHEVQLIIEMNERASIYDFVDGLKTLTSETLRNQFKSLSTYPNVWERRYGVFTIGSLEAARKTVLEDTVESNAVTANKVVQ